MDKLFDKLGLYDFWGTFIPGFIGVIVLTNVLEYLNINSVLHLNFDYTLVFYIVYSYLLGVLLHELGHFVQDNIIYRKNPFPIICLPRNHGEPYDTFLDNENHFFSSEEKKLYDCFFQEWQQANNITPDNTHRNTRLFFDYCNYFIEREKKDVKAAKMQSLYGMSRSLFVFFGLLTIAIYPSSIYFHSDSPILNIIFLSLCATIIFYIRMKRFNIIRLKVVMRTFLVNK